MARRVLGFSGTLNLGGNPIDITLSVEEADGQVTLVGGIEKTLSFADLARSFGLDLGGVPDALLPTVDSVSVVIGPASTMLLAASTDDVDIVLLVDRSATPRTLASMTVRLAQGSDLPVIGSLLQAGKDIGLAAFDVLIASQSFSSDDVKAFNAVLDNVPVSAGASAPNGRFPTRDIPRGSTISADLSLGETSHTIDFTVPADSAAREFVGSIAQPVSFAGLAQSFGLDLRGVPDELLPTVDSVAVVIGPGSTMLLAASTDDVDVVLLVGRSATPRYLASVTVRLAHGSGIPVIGVLLQAANDIGLTALDVLIASQAFAATDVAPFNTALDNVPVSADASGPKGRFPSRDIPQGSTISADLSLGGTDHTIDFGFPTNSLAPQFSGSIAQVSFADLARSIGLDVDGVPDDLMPTLDSVSVVIGPKTTMLAASTGDLEAVLLADRIDMQPRYLASVRVQRKIGLSSLPVIDDVLPSGEDLGLTAFSLVIASQDFAPSDVAAFNTILNNAATPLPARQIASGPTFSADLSLGATSHTIDLALAAGPAPPPAAAPAPAGAGRMLAVAAPASPGAAPASSEKWFSVQKSFGPVSVNRVGLAYRHGKVSLMLDAGFMMAAVDVSLLGARISFKPGFPPSGIAPGIDGIAIAVQGGAIAISGGLLVVDRPDGNTEYDGQLMIQAGAYLLTALASYTKVDGAASLFAFVALDAPLGGPPFFYVTGVAVGFGVNRDLIVPGIDGVTGFPLLEAVNGNSPFTSNTDPGLALQTMAVDVPPKYGAYWLALGVRFTTFELLQSAALVTISLGTDIEIDLLGLSQLLIPTGAPDPIAYAELALEASFRPSEGVLSIAGQLTPASYVLSHDCHLVGGFAMRAWFEDVGEARAGDFVVTLGGYHPAFPVPSWYPTAVPIGAIWQVNSHLLIKGGFYFALTPSAVMAGGFIDATWRSGDLKAWFSCYADFLLSWKPFYYEIDIGIHIGASFTVDLWLTSYTATIHVGVDLGIWGPSFAGRAHVDVSLISFTVHFGDSSPSLAPIAWSEFKSSFLPKPTAARGGTVNAARATSNQADVSVCTARVSGGLIKDLSNTSADGPDWVINSERFELTTFSSVPCKVAAVTVGSDSVPLPATGSSQAFGVGPVGIAEGDFASTHSVEIHRADLSGNGASTGPEITLSAFRITAAIVQKNVPKAAWLRDVALNPQASLQQTVPVVEDVLVGITLSAATEDPDVTPLAMDLAMLQFERPPPQRPFAYWTQPAVPDTDPFQGEDPPATLITPLADTGDARKRAAMATFMTALADTGVARKRAGIVALLGQQNVLAPNLSTDMSRMAQGADIVLLSAPTLALLGEETNAA